MITVLFVGDIVGRPGREFLSKKLGDLIKEYTVDVVIANGENAAGGNGITRKTADELFSAGVNILTMGNHTWDNRDIFNFIDKEERLLRPANYPPGTPGRGFCLFRQEKKKVTVGVVNLSGRVFLNPLDCPFRKAAEMVEDLKQYTPVVIVDFHAEATSEKEAMGWYLDGKVSALIGTHTHVQTADERILPKGTAYITDVGMTGPRDAVLGVDKEVVQELFVSRLPIRFEVGPGPSILNAVLVEIDEESGTASSIRRLWLNEQM